MDIAIRKQADKATATPGGTIAYTVTVTNTGQLPIPFSAITVTDPMLAALSLSGPAPSSLAPGESLTYTGSRAVTAADCGTLPNTATVALTGDVQAETTTANNVASVTVAVAGGACTPAVIGQQNAIIAIRKTGPKFGQVHRAVTYAIRVTNTSKVAARNVVVTDPIPAGMSLAKRPHAVTIRNGRVVWSVGDLQPGQSVTVRLMLLTDVNATRTRCNVASAAAANAPTVRGRACTRFVRLGAVVVPKVTG